MKNLNSAVEKHRQKILDAERYIWKNPETGYKEVKTSKYMENIFRELGYELTMAGNIPGFFTVFDTGRQGPEVLVLSELDSVVCPSHKDADPKTGAVHACGHNTQCAAMVGIAAALKEPGIADKLCGRIKLCVVPAEELLEIEFRTELKKQGIIKYMGGKSEFLSRGYFDSCDLAFMVHSSTRFSVLKGAVGCIAKKITYKGVASHAGEAPWEGKNALYAANCGINAINAIRETFKESDIIRVHPIITNGGSIVNAIPEQITMESYIRGNNFPAMFDVNRRVNQALCGAALSVGTNIEITDIPGYSPLVNDDKMRDIVKEAAALVIPEYELEMSDTILSSSTDMGDLSSIIPSVHPYAGGCKGTLHGSDFSVADPEAACVANAKLQLGMLYILLSDNAHRANEIIKNFKPRFASKEEYFSYVDSLTVEGDRIEYLGKSAKINLGE